MLILLKQKSKMELGKRNRKTYDALVPTKRFKPNDNSAKEEMANAEMTDDQATVKRRKDKIVPVVLEKFDKK